MDKRDLDLDLGADLKAHRRPGVTHDVAADDCIQGGGGVWWAVNLVWEIWHFNLAAKFTT